MSVRVGVCVLALLMCAVGIHGGDAKKDRENLKGSWELVEMVRNEQTEPQDKIEGAKIIFDANKMTLVTKREERGFSYTLDPSKKPNAIDTTALNGTFIGKSMPGIYELKGDSLKLCLPNTVTTERPSEFKSAKGSNLVLMTLKRTKP